MVKIFSNSHKKKVNRFKAVFFLTTPLSISRSFAREAPIFIFWHLSRRDLTTLTWTRLLQGIASSHPHISLNRNLAVPWVTPLISNYVCWMFFLVPSVHAMGCKKTKYGYGTRTSWGERHFSLRNLHWHTSCIKKLESKHVIVPATMIADNSMEPNPDEVRSHCSDSILTQKLVWKLTEHRSNKIKLRYGHCERSPDPVSICIFSGPSSVPERGN